MKKFYMLIAVAFVSATLLLSSSTLLAQTGCPAGTQKVFRTVGYDATGQPVYTVYIENFWPNSNISLFQGSTPIFVPFQAVTDANGNGRIIYDGNLYNPTSVVACPPGGCCVQPVPPASAACPGTAFNVIYPATPTTPELCCIYLSNSLPQGEVRVFDVFQNLIPTASSAFAFTDISGFTCYVYECTNLASSLTICGASGCCSYQVGAAASLPIKLKNFSAKLTTNNNVVLNWASELEIGSDRFVVEKSSDGRNFAAIGEVKSGGNTTISRTYAFTDASFSATAFYRLKMIDIDDKAEYSKVVYVNVRGGSGLVTQIFPNPFKSDIQIIGISSSDLNPRNVKVFNSTGQQVNFKITGANAISIDEHAPRGMYILAIKEQRFKLIKE